MDLLLDILLKFGFFEKWVNQVMMCVTPVQYHALVESDEIGPIVPQHGIRQGDPLSPYMFIVMAKGLSALIRNYETRGLFHGVAIAMSAPRISHLLFADDSFIFFKTNPKES